MRRTRTVRFRKRVGATVLRPTGAHSSFVHSLLRHLETKGFAGAPRWIGVDPGGREILSYLPGDVPAELGRFSADQVAAGAHLLRELHDANRAGLAPGLALARQATASA